MNNPKFTILLPVHRLPALLPYSIESVLAQECGDFELFIVCDGAPPETADHARAMASRDSRIHAMVFPKGERLGEAYRHAVLMQARGSMVCQIGDDDLWLPNHLCEMEKLLADCEFGNLLQANLIPGGEFYVHAGDLAEPGIRRQMLREKFNFFGPSVAGYRLSAYRRLPVGWSPAPAGIFHDLFMWRKFLAIEGLVAKTRVAVTCIGFPTPRRKDWTLEQRAKEMSDWTGWIGDSAFRDRITQKILLTLVYATFNERRLRAGMSDNKGS